MRDLIQFKCELLSFLEQNRGYAYSMQELAEQFGEQRWLVQKAISQLDDEGTVILKTTGKGMRTTIWAAYKEVVVA